MSKSWRSGPKRYLNARPIYEKDWPKLIESMWNDGLIAVITTEGVIWYHGGYIIKPTSVREVWGLSRTQMRRLNDWVYVHDPFININPE